MGSELGPEVGKFLDREAGTYLAQTRRKANESAKLAQQQVERNQSKSGPKSGR